MIGARLWTALGMGPRNQLLALEAVAVLTASRVALARRSFAEIAAVTGQLVAPDDPRAVQSPPTEAQRIVIRQVRWAIAATAPHLPFRAKCLQQALAARAMLDRRGIASVIHFGTMRVGQALAEGHVWLDAGGIGVTGFPVDPALTEIGCLVSADQAPARS